MEYNRKRETQDFIRDVVKNGRTVVPAVVAVDLLNDALRAIIALEKVVDNVQRAVWEEGR